MRQLKQTAEENLIHEVKRLHPPARLGIIGGGQLGRMLTLEAKRMGYQVVVLDPKPDAPAGQVADEQIQADFADGNALSRLAEHAEVLTYEFEHLDLAALKTVEAGGVRLIPSARTLGIIQDKFEQKRFLRDRGIPVPDFYRIDSFEDLRQAYDQLGGRLVLKTRRDGYDGKGTWIITAETQLREAFEAFRGAALMAEAFVDFKKEVSMLAVRGSEGVAVYPLAENVHEDGILIHTSVPADVSSVVELAAKDVTLEILSVFDDFGVFCVEYFVDENNHIFVNEIAPRPHNSGHYTIEACVTSQYEQLIRVMTGMPLGSTTQTMPCVMWNLLGEEAFSGEYRLNGTEKLMAEEACYLHLYGKKETGPLRKLGHVTVLGQTLAAAREKAERLRQAVSVERLPGEVASMVKLQSDQETERKRI